MILWRGRFNDFFKLMFDDRLFVTGKSTYNYYFIISLLNLANVLNNCLPSYIDLGCSKSLRSQILNFEYYELEERMAT